MYNLVKHETLNSAFNYYFLDQNSEHIIVYSANQQQQQQKAIRVSWFHRVKTAWVQSGALSRPPGTWVGLFDPQVKGGVWREPTVGNLSTQSQADGPALKLRQQTVGHVITEMCWMEMDGDLAGGLSLMERDECS